MIALLQRSAAQARYPLIGSFALLFGFQLVIVGQAAEIQRTQSFGRMAELLPAFLQRGLGSRALLLATFKGTVAFGYFHPVVCVLVSVIAIYVMTEPAHEIEAGLVDLELARSVPRHRLLTRSVILAAASIAAAALLMALGTSAGGRLFAAGSFDLPSAGTRARLLVHLAGVAACFSGLGLFIAVWSRRWMTAFTTAVLITVVAYLVDFLAIGWRPMRAVVWISPFHYYPALSIIAGDAPEGRNLAVLYSAAVVFIALAYWRFSRRDL
jgi:ABC-type transport system involved in multi-copper enzyme maturation permease subunit